MILSKHVSKSTGLTMVGATVLLLVLQIFFNYIAEASKLSNEYTALKAFKFVLWQAPEQLYYTLPVSVLIGAVVGLGMMSAASELVVMRAAGVSVWRIVNWVLRPALGFALFSLVLSQWILPYSMPKAMSVKYEDGGVREVHEVHGYWLHDGNQIAFIEYANTNGEIRNLNRMVFDDQLQLRESLFAQSGQYIAQPVTTTPTLVSAIQPLSDAPTARTIWQLHNVQTATPQANGAMLQVQSASKDIALDLQPKYVQVVTKDPETLKPSTLYRYIRYLSSMGKVPAKYSLALWQTLAAPMALMAIVMLACSFVFGSMRQQSMGLRIVLALFVGLAFKYSQEFLGYASLVSVWSPGWFVCLPILGIFLISLYSLSKIR